MTIPDARPLPALLEGARAFREREYRDPDALMPGLAAGQRPRVMVIGCSDSRVDPALVCGARPGEVFSVRNVANLVPPPGSGAVGHGVTAAVEYAVKALGVSDLVVLGHAGCGGMAAALDAARGGGAAGLETLGPWLESATAVCREVLSEPRDRDGPEGAGLARRVERRSILASLANLRSWPWIRGRMDGGTLALHGWWFDIATGTLWTADPDEGVFRPLE